MHRRGCVNRHFWHDHGYGGEDRGYEGAKKVKGRKRHLLVDTQGLVLELRVQSAKVVDRGGIKLLLEPSMFDRLPRLSHLWLDDSLHRSGEQGRRVDGEDSVVDREDRKVPTLFVQALRSIGA
jgi:Transposase DDE domain